MSSMFSNPLQIKSQQRQPNTIEVYDVLVPGTQPGHPKQHAPRQLPRQKHGQKPWPTNCIELHERYAHSPMGQGNLRGPGHPRRLAVLHGCLHDTGEPHARQPAMHKYLPAPTSVQPLCCKPCPPTSHSKGRAGSTTQHCFPQPTTPQHLSVCLPSLAPVNAVCILVRTPSVQYPTACSCSND